MGRDGSGRWGALLRSCPPSRPAADFSSFTSLRSAPHRPDPSTAVGRRIYCSGAGARQRLSGGRATERSVLLPYFLRLTWSRAGVVHSESRDRTLSNDRVRPVAVARDRQLSVELKISTVSSRGPSCRRCSRIWVCGLGHCSARPRETSARPRETSSRSARPSARLERRRSGDRIPPISARIRAPTSASDRTCEHPMKRCAAFRPMDQGTGRRFRA